MPRLHFYTPSEYTAAADRSGHAHLPRGMTISCAQLFIEGARLVRGWYQTGPGVLCIRMCRALRCLGLAARPFDDIIDLDLITFADVVRLVLDLV